MRHRQFKKWCVQLWLAILVICSGALITGCPLAHEDINLNECISDDDCFVNGAEYCDKGKNNSETFGVCRVARDAAIPDTRVIDLMPKDHPIPSDSHSDSISDSISDSTSDQLVSDGKLEGGSNKSDAQKSDK